MRIHLSEHFTYKKLLRFVLPSVVMMIFTSIYSVVDGLFVSRFVGKSAFAAINLVSPMLTILGTLGIMLGTGGAAIVGKTLGESGREKSSKANEYFSMLIYAVIIIGVIFGIIGALFIPDIIGLLGAKESMKADCLLYGRVILCALPFFILSYAFQSFFVTAEKPQIGLAVTVLGGVSNILLDALFILVFRQGLFGAALATALSQTLCGILEILYFARKNDSLLQLKLKIKFHKDVFYKACINGSSEMVGNMASSVVAMVYNYQLLKYIGENGVAAYGVIEYIGFIFSAIFIGYTMGVSSAVSYQYGAGNHDELKNICKKSLFIIGVTGVLMVIIAWGLSGTIAGVFVGYDKELYRLTMHAISIYMISFLFSGYSIFGSAFFTALNNGVMSAVISFVRTFIFEIGCVLILPAIIGVDGIWIAIVVAEVAALCMTFIIFVANRKRYQYI